MKNSQGLVLPDIITGPFENRWLDITTEEYHADRRAVHSSSLTKILKSPYAYRYHLINPTIPTDAMEFGRIAHVAILEGSKFLEKYVVEPIFKGTTADGKETTSRNALSVKQAYAEWRASLPVGTEIVSQEDLDRIRWMLDSILSHPFASEILKEGMPEAKGVWVDPETKLRCLFQPDFVSYSLSALVEFKTTPDCSWFEFRRSVEKLRYDVQNSFYEEGFFRVTKKHPDHRVWIATESVKPFETRVHEVHTCYQESGRIDFTRALRDIKHCIQTNQWPQGQNVLDEAQPSPWFEQRYTGVEI